jgi:hypothetical protein
MTNSAGESNDAALRFDFDRRVMLQFRGSVVTSDAGRELDDVLGLSALASDVLADPRTGRNGRHALAGLFRQSVFGRLAGYEDVNDADRLRHDPAHRLRFTFGVVSQGVFRGLWSCSVHRSPPGPSAGQTLSSASRSLLMCSMTSSRVAKFLGGTRKLISISVPGGFRAGRPVRRYSESANGADIAVTPRLMG